MTLSTVNTMWQADALKSMQRSPDSAQREALNNFIAEGFPTRRHENWRYTNVSGLAKQHFALSHSADLSANIDSLIIPGTYRLTFVNGQYVKAWSDLVGLPEGVVLESGLTSSVEDQPAALNEYVTPFSHLNVALATEGLFLKVPRGVELDKPIHVLYLNTASDAAIMNHPRHRIVVESEASASVLEEYVGLSGEAYFNNVVTQITARPASRLEHYKLQRESAQAFHIANTMIAQERDSVVQTVSISLGALLSRDDLNYALLERGTESSLLGLYYLNDHAHCDHHSRIDHLAPHCSSGQHYKGIVADESRAVFNGKVVVHPHAANTIANQSNQNILLSNSAEVDTKPELEIYTDDVRCTHGATIGQLDREALFYLQSRGIPKAEAKQFLLSAFGNEVLDSLARNVLSEHIAQHVALQLSKMNAKGA